MELFKTFPAYSWLFIFANTEIYVKYVKPIEKLSRRHLINSFNVWLIYGLTVYEKELITRHNCLCCLM